MKFTQLLKKELKHFDLTDDEQREEHYRKSDLENDANYFAHNFMKNIKKYHRNRNHLTFNEYLLKDIDVFCDWHFPNNIVYDKQNYHKAYKEIKKIRIKSNFCNRDAKDIYLLLGILIFIFFLIYIYPAL